MYASLTGFISKVNTQIVWMLGEEMCTVWVELFQMHVI